MTPDSNPAAEELLRALLVGDRRESDPELVALFAARPDLAARYRRMKGLVERLDSVGSLDREVLAQAKTLPGPEPGAMRAALDRARGRHRFRWWPLVALAALLVVGAVLVLRSRESQGPLPNSGSTLGSHEGKMKPVGVLRAPRYEEFSWDLPLPKGGHYALTFYADESKKAVLLRREDLRQPRWTPTSEERALLADKMTWEVEVFDAGGRPRPSACSASVSLVR